MKTVTNISFDAYGIPGGEEAILGPSQCGADVAKVLKCEGPSIYFTRVEITLDDNDERIPKVIRLLKEHGEEPRVFRRDIYTENDLQAARLLHLSGWWESSAPGGLAFGTTYDRSSACSNCSTGMRQTSPLIIGGDDMRRIEKHRVAGTHTNDVLVRDTDVERLIAANVTGALFWPGYLKAKSGELTELRWQQAVIESVMPPLVDSTRLSRKTVCSTCNRGGYTVVVEEPDRLFYRAEDLAKAQDFNLSWEWFGDYCKREEPQYDLVPHPMILVTPKVMNLLRGKTKKEQKYQGCDFIPIWIEDANGPVDLETRRK
jgi:hypothetical protein